MSRWQEIWRGFRRDEQAVLLICTIVLAFCAGLNYTRWRTATPLPPLFEDAPRAAGTNTAGKSGSAVARASTILVHVTGAVRKPGVLTLPGNARTVDAIRSAGGATPDSDVNNLNLAAHLQDGQQIVVPSRQKAVPSRQKAVQMPVVPSPLGAASQSSTKKSKKEFVGVVNINRASAAELEALPGVGPAIAGRIIAYRTQHGPFRSLSDLDAVKGIGVKKLEDLKDHVAF
ncbi:MAG TPA: ComEA family DNA-binding protein [Abditibacteriaceae bacterium]|nr:ComEA family DNA-binding protein [Abditibacteriaceae bacterium]